MIKSSFCGTSNSCVYVGLVSPTGPVAVNDSDQASHESPGVWFTREEWEVFIQGVKAGEFDWPKLGTTAKEIDA